MTCTSASNCWAVGHHARPHGDNVNLALHWNGQSWSWAATPQPDKSTGGHVRQLNAIRCVSKSDCWAVGFWGTSGPKNGTEAFRWSGSEWSSVSTPKVGEAMAVACTSVANCWAVTNGNTTTAHWTGTRWSAVGIPQSASKQNSLGGVGCARATECWAAGTLNDSGVGELTDMMRWNGTKWTRVPTPSPGTSQDSDNSAVNELDGVVCSSATSCWAVGSYWDYSASTRYSILLRWNGTSWSTG